MKSIILVMAALWAMASVATAKDSVMTIDQLADWSGQSVEEMIVLTNWNQGETFVVSEGAEVVDVRWNRRDRKPRRPVRIPPRRVRRCPPGYRFVRFPFGNTACLPPGHRFPSAPRIPGIF